MVNLKNYNVVLKHFVLFLTFYFAISCTQQKYYISKIEGKKIGITNESGKVSGSTSNNISMQVEKYIQPYRENIDKDLNTILAIAPISYDKNGEWQTSMGIFLADITLEKSNPVFKSRENKSIDICLLNHGGIRSTISKGDVTARTAYEVMPFENSAVVVALKSEQILEIANYIITEKKPHPLAGMTFTIDKNNTVKNIFIQGKPLVSDTIYYVVTSDYLSNGGDNMVFFKNGLEKFDLEYKLRNIMIDYFKEVDTLSVKTDNRISKE